ncbi:MAG: mechanosensitive ion channel family protein [Clostridia bacterium]|nr:mechanosensitive ion channel family protein [Clostridia bacterium]
MDEVITTVNQSLDDATHVFGDAVKTVSWPALLTRIAVAALIVAAGIVILWLLRKVLNRIFKRKCDDGQSESQRKTLHTLLSSLLSFSVYFAMICMALSALGVNVESLLAVAGVGGVAVGFGCQTLVKDFVSGLFLWLEGHLKVGDVVTVGGLTGTVERMSLRTTTLRATNGNLYTIPNGDIRTVVNMTRDFRFALVDVTVAHNQNYQAAITALQQAMAVLDEQEKDLEEVPKVVGITACDRFAATIRIECKCDVEVCWDVERKIRQAALECLKKEGFAL